MSKPFLLIQVAAACLFGSGAALFFRRSSLWDGVDSTAAPTASAPAPARADDRRAIVCTGRVEPLHGEIDISAQLAGQLAEVRVAEGDVITEGQILAVLIGKREAAELAVAEANVAVARARLARAQAGNGEEEIQQARHDVESLEANLAYERSNLSRLDRLYSNRTLARDEFERQLHKVEQVERQLAALRKRYEAIRRGPLPEDIQVARSELEAAEQRLRRARVEDDLRTVRAPTAGTILEVYRHGGDSVLIEQPTPILRMADMGQLQIRLEIDEANAARIHPGVTGTLEIRGAPAGVARLAVTKIIPVFGPKRLFDPDTSARYDTRILVAFCEVQSRRVPLYAGQRVTAYLDPDAVTASRR